MGQIPHSELKDNDESRGKLSVAKSCNSQELDGRFERSLPAADSSLAAARDGAFILHHFLRQNACTTVGLSQKQCSVQSSMRYTPQMAADLQHE